jgi:hypothetical protein
MSLVRIIRYKTISETYLCDIEMAERLKRIANDCDDIITDPWAIGFFDHFEKSEPIKIDEVFKEAEILIGSIV